MTLARSRSTKGRHGKFCKEFLEVIRSAKLFKNCKSRMCEDFDKELWVKEGHVKPGRLAGGLEIFWWIASGLNVFQALIDWFQELPPLQSFSICVFLVKYGAEDFIKKVCTASLWLLTPASGPVQEARRFVINYYILGRNQGLKALMDHKGMGRLSRRTCLCQRNVSGGLDWIWAFKSYQELWNR